MEIVLHYTVTGERVNQRFVFLFLIISLAAVSLSCGKSTPSERPFLMGFSNSPHEISPSGRIQAQQFLEKYSDLILEDFAEGIPWEEALRSNPLPPEVLVSLRIRKRKLKGKPLFIHLSPFNIDRSGLAKYWPDRIDESVKAAWKEKGFGDQDVKAAYVRFCLDLIRRFEPQYFAYAVDVNQFAAQRPDQWKDFVQFAGDVYTQLKKEHPNIPIFLNFNAGSFWQNPEAQETVIRDVLPYTDLIAVSAYPELSGFTDVSKLPKDFFSRLADLGSTKPFAVAETGYPHPQDSDKKSDATFQKRYLEFVLRESYKLDARFVVWFHYRDFKQIAENHAQSLNSTPNSIELLDSRKDYGLVDDAGNSKNSHAVWKLWFQLPFLKENSDPV